jgi:anaerobic ribonucleoside-triphosphate reductase activating protein
VRPSPTPVRVNRMHHPVTALGHGLRAGIWVQGCTIGCTGCASRDTWDPGAGQEIDPAAVVRWLDTLPGRLDGVTVSGGEPFQQPEALAGLLAELAAWRADRELDLLVFSGYAWPRLATRPECAAALALCDAVVAGPYVERRNTGVALRGSDNQQIVPLTALGRARYGDPASLPVPPMQVSLDGDTVRLIGIPRRGDLDRMRAGLAARGIAVEAVTWQG